MHVEIVVAFLRYRRKSGANMAMHPRKISLQYTSKVTLLIFKFWGFTKLISFYITLNLTLTLTLSNTLL